MSQRTLVPDPWCPLFAYQAVSDITGVVSPASGALNSAANRAVYVPVVLPISMTLYSLAFYAGNGTGNYDLGLYLGDYTRIASTGSTAMSAAGVKTLSLPDLRFRAGTLLYMALVLSSTSGTVIRGAFTAVNRMDVVDVRTQASALPLPNPMVPAVAAESTIPIFAFGVR